MEERKETGGEEKEEKQRRKRLGQGKVRHSHHLEQDGARLDLSERSQGGNTDKTGGTRMDKVVVFSGKDAMDLQISPK